ncbi:ABC transporter substrate-binding protein [Herbaspirillum lusitanum]|uniref:ABC transporter substrate-binding protein n=1 Tax=Herbaspirillum lusitanum TaxID=213312 RepID=A0ABW9A6Y7_9BURK
MFRPHRNVLSVLAASLLFVSSSAPVRAETGVSTERILLGQSASLTGPLATVTEQLLIGARAYFNEVNAKGGVHGRRIDLITRDDRYDAAMAAENTLQLIQKDQVFALFGYVGWPTTEASVPVFTQAKVPFFAPLTGAPSIYKDFNRYLFTVRASYFGEYQHFIGSLKLGGIKAVALIYQRNIYGEEALHEVERMLEKTYIAYQPMGLDLDSANLPSIIKQLMKRPPDVIFMLNSQPLANAALVKGMRAAGFLGHFFGVSFVGQRDLLDTLGTMARGISTTQVVPSPWRVSIPLVAEYRKTMLRAGRSEFTFSSMEGFIAARVLVEGLRRAGRELTREKLIRALESINEGNFDGRGFPINYSQTDHHGSDFVDTATVTSNSRFIN